MDRGKWAVTVTPFYLELNIFQDKAVKIIIGGPWQVGSDIYTILSPFYHFYDLSDHANLKTDRLLCI